MKTSRPRQKVFANSALDLEKLEIRRLHEKVERLFNVLQDALELDETNAPSAFSPPLDLCETEEAVCVRVELPGLEPKDINLIITAKDLIVEGEKNHSVHTEKAITHYCCERRYGKFHRKINLRWAININKSSAELKDGTLLIHLPKLDDRRGKAVKIPIKAED